MWSPVTLSQLRLRQERKGRQEEAGGRRKGRGRVWRTRGEPVPSSLGEVPSLRSYQSHGSNQTQGLTLDIWMHKRILHDTFFSESKGFRKLELCSNLCPSKVKHNQIWASTEFRMFKCQSCYYFKFTIVTFYNIILKQNSFLPHWTSVTCSRDQHQLGNSLAPCGLWWEGGHSCG